MDDLNALERQIEGQLNGFAGPVLPVDDAAIFAAVAASQFPKWRFQSIFSATKFVVAGAIVALFGGFLLVGVLTQPNDDPAPAAASPSATADLLSTLDTEEIAPGVFRVLSDGQRGLDTKIHRVAISPEGDIWVLKFVDQSMAIRIMQVGEPGVAYRLDDSTGAHAFQRLVTGDDGSIGYAQSIYDVPAVLEGGEWIANEGSRYENCVRLFGSVAADGTCFENEPRGPGLMQQTVEESRFVPARNVGSFGYDARAPLFEIRLGQPVANDGVVWVPAFRDDGGTSDVAITFEGLAKYDGASWSSIPYPKESVLPFQGPMSVTADGVVWVPSYTAGNGLTVVSWDGEGWHSYGPLAVPRASAEAYSHQDGTTTFGVMAGFDGTSLVRLELPDRVIQDMGPLTFAPDGSAWAVKDSGLYVIKPEAFATVESWPASASR